MLILSGMFYFCISLLSTVLLHFSKRVNGKTEKILLFATIFFPSFIAGIRYGIGTDYIIYATYFDSIKRGFIFRTDIAFGFAFLNKVIAILGGNVQVVLFICSFMTIYFVIRTIRFYSNNINIEMAYFTFMLMYYQMSYNIVRQILAMSICLYMTTKLKNKEWIKIGFLMVLACSVHTTAILMIGIIILYPFINDRKKFISISLIYLASIWFLFNFSLFQNVLLGIDSLSYYAGYLRKTGELHFSLGIVLRFIPFIIPYYFIKRDKDESISIAFYLRVYVIGSILRLLTYMTQFDAERFAYYFLFFQVILVGYYFKYNKRNYKIFGVNTLLLIIIVFLWLNDFIINGWHETIPYQTIFGRL